jgi:hypothetical protein
VRAAAASKSGIGGWECRGRGSWGWTCGGAQAGAVEDHGFYFAFGALGRELLAIEGEAYTSGVSGSDYDFAGGTDQGVSGCDERFVDYGLAVGGHGDPGIFRSTNHQGEVGDWPVRWRAHGVCIRLYCFFSCTGGIGCAGGCGRLRRSRRRRSRWRTGMSRGLGGGTDGRRHGRGHMR